MSERLVKIRWLTTARGPTYRHDEGQVVEVELAEARRQIAAGIAVAVDPADLLEEGPAPSAPETAELRPHERAVASPQPRVGPRRRPSASTSERPGQG